MWKSSQQRQCYTKSGVRKRWQTDTSAWRAELGYKNIKKRFKSCDSGLPYKASSPKYRQMTRWQFLWDKKLNYLKISLLKHAYRGKWREIFTGDVLIAEGEIIFCKGEASAVYLWSDRNCIRTFRQKRLKLAVWTVTELKTLEELYTTIKSSISHRLNTYLMKKKPP